MLSPLQTSLRECVGFRHSPSFSGLACHQLACPTCHKVDNCRHSNGLDFMYENAFNSIERELRNEDGIANELDYVEQMSAISAHGTV
jgi:hypothetical protein